jgi:hypothetical protein
MSHSGPSVQAEFVLRRRFLETIIWGLFACESFGSPLSTLRFLTEQGCFVTIQHNPLVITFSFYFVRISFATGAEGRLRKKWHPASEGKDSLYLLARSL